MSHQITEVKLVVSSLETDLVIDIGLKTDKAFWYPNMGICLTFYGLLQIGGDEDAGRL